MNKEELEKEIAKTKEQLVKLQKALEYKGYGRWKPQYTGKYWCVTAQCGVSYCNFTKAQVDYALYAAHNCFQTKEQAEIEANKILVRRQLEDIARRLNKGEDLDWSNPNQDKFQIYYAFRAREIQCETRWRDKVAGVVYCLDENFKDVAIKEIGEERLTKYLKGE